MPPRLAVCGNDSGGEGVQRLLPDAQVVKAFNTVGNPYMFRPDFPGGPPEMFICGNHEDAKKRVARILQDFGWGSSTSAASRVHGTSNPCASCGCCTASAPIPGTTHSSCCGNEEDEMVTAKGTGGAVAVRSIAVSRPHSGS
jgi:hypothetical protein